MMGGGMEEIGAGMGAGTGAPPDPEIGRGTTPGEIGGGTSALMLGGGNFDMMQCTRLASREKREQMKEQWSLAHCLGHRPLASPITANTEAVAQQ